MIFPLVVLISAAPAELPLSCNAQAKPLFASARQAIGNARTKDAEALLRKALAADPKCVIATAMLGRVLPDAEGKKLVDDAVAAPTAGLTDVEKALIEMVKADRDGETAKALAAAVKARDLAPKVAQLNVDVAEHAQGVLDWKLVVEAANAATSLEPGNAQGWNLLGYGYLGLHQHEQAVTAFTKYVEVAPNEPNAHDSLADALLEVGKLNEAAAEYQKAIDQKMWVSYHGLATVKVVGGDLAAAGAALDAWRANTDSAADKLDALFWKASLQVAMGKLPDALKSMDVMAKEAPGSKLDFFVVAGPLWRADLLTIAGKHADAAKVLAGAEKLPLDAFSEGQRRRLTAWRLASTAIVAARLGKTADAEKALAQVEEIFAPLPNEVRGKNLIAQTKGAIAMAKKDFTGAAAAFAGCTELFDVCRALRVEALEKSKDAAGAKELRTALLESRRRDPGHWLARWMVAAKK